MVTELQLQQQKAAESSKQLAAIRSFDTLGPQLLSEFMEFEQARRETEQRWLKDLRQYHGIYEQEVLERIEKGRSTVFIKKTRSKVDTFRARAHDMLFPANRERNWDVDATPKPTVPPQKRTEIARLLKAASATKDQQGKTVFTDPSSQDIDGAVKQFVKKAASGMGDVIDDQLTESGYRNMAKDVLFDGGLFGTGLVKGPLVARRTRRSFELKDDVAPKTNFFDRMFGRKKAQAEGKKGPRYEMVETSEPTPFVERTSLWRFYPDMEVTEIQRMRKCFEHHRMGQNKLLELADNPTFDGERIRDYVNTLPLGYVQPRAYEKDLRTIGDRNQGSASNKGQYDLLEHWGWVSQQDLRKVGIESDKPVFCNIWLLFDGSIIKVVRQPVPGVQYPYNAYYYRKDDTSIFGEGICKIGRDNQETINAAARMLLDNAAITAGPQLEAFTDWLSSEDVANLDNVRPFRVWARTSGDGQYPALRAINIESHLEEFMQILKLFDDDFDEVTALPKYLYGDNPTNGAASTMGGLSMLQGNANITLKDAIVSFDEGVTKPLITGMYYWNMAFHPDNSIKGDFDVQARGASSMVAKEVRAQQLMQFNQAVPPEARTLVKWREFLEAMGQALDLGDFVMTESDAQAAANTPAALLQSQMAEMQAKLGIAHMQASVKEIEGKVAKLAEESKNIGAATLKLITDAVYAAMQAGGVAATTPNAAMAGDEILRSAGYKDQSPPEGSGPGPGMPVPQVAAQAPAATTNIPASGQPPQPQEPTAVTNPSGPGVGEHAGIETQQLEAAH